MPPVDTPAEEFLQLYGEGAWKDWQRFLAHFDLGKGFAFLILLLPGAVGADISKRQLAEYLAGKGEYLAVLECEEFVDVRGLAERLFDLEIKPNLGGIWLGSVISESDAEIHRWKEAWHIGLTSLNQQRNPLLRRFQCPLVLVGAPWLQPLLREAAPDLWSVRTAVVHVTPALKTAPGTESNQIWQKTFQERMGEAASDPDFALEQAESLRERPGLEATRAELLRRAANGFHKHTRLEQAEKCVREAAEIYSLLAPALPDLQQDWAGTLNNLAVVLSELGRHEESLDKAQVAMRIYGQLAKARPEVFLPELAWSMSTVANSLSDLGRREEALKKAQEATLIYERFASARPDTFLPDLAMSLNNLANRLNDLGRREEALEKAQEATRVYERLANVLPDPFLPDFATSLNNLAKTLNELGRREEALEKAQQAARIHEKLAKVRPDAFLPGLANSQNNLAVILSDLGRREDALGTAQEAVRTHVQLAQDRPDAFLPRLAISFGALGSVLQRLERDSDAADSFARGIRALRPSFEKSPTVFAKLMADLCRNYVEATRKANAEPDTALLAPVTGVLAKLKQPQAKE